MHYSKDELKIKLTDEQYRVTQCHGTEKPFQNEYWNEERLGIYVDIVSGAPLFSSLDKFRSKSGWPSFLRPISEAEIIVGKNPKYWMTRNEVRSTGADSHLGHVFERKELPTGKYYCINSASLRFIPLERMEEEGYGNLLPLFEEASKKKIDEKYFRPSDEEIRDKLTEEEFQITQFEKTEKHYRNEYWDYFADGIFVDKISGEPLFSSKDKVREGGWPSFTRPMEPGNLVYRYEHDILTPRQEVKSKIGRTHLGHVFKDDNITGERYCINSASLRFIALHDLEAEGYGEYLKFF